MSLSKHVFIFHNFRGGKKGKNEHEQKGSNTIKAKLYQDVGVML